MERRAFISGITIGLLAAPLVAAGQPTAKVHKLGLLPFDTCRPANDTSDPLRPELAKHGYLEGENIVIECRAAPGDPEQHRMLAQELVNLKVDVVIAQSTSSALAARQATTTTLGPEAARREVSDEPGQGAPLPRANFADESG